MDDRRVAATRGWSGEIITKIEKEVNHRRERGDYNFAPHWIDWQWQTERLQDRGAGDEMVRTGKVKQWQKRL